MREKALNRSHLANTIDVGVHCLADVRAAIIFIDNFQVIGIKLLIFFLKIKAKILLEKVGISRGRFFRSC